MSAKRQSAQIRRMLLRTLALLLLTTLPSAPAMAGPLEEGTEAFQRTDYQKALQLLQRLADQGQAQAQALVGMMYFYGLGGTEDLPAGLKWLRKAADQGLADAQYQLGLVYENNREVKQDYAEAMKWFRKASDQGNPTAQRAIGDLYFQGLGVKMDKTEADKWYEKSRRLPQLPAEIVKGLAAASSISLYSLQPYGGPDLPEWDFHGHHVLGQVLLRDKEAQAAIAALNLAVSNGDANMESGCFINPRHALRFEREGNTYDLLVCYQCGQLAIFKNELYLPFQGMISGDPKVFNRLLKAAKVTLADTPDALNKSYAEEAKLALKRAQEGDSTAQEVIARLLMRGQGVKKDLAGGIQWRAKSLGLAPDSPEFQVTLGEMYKQGELGNDLRLGQDMTPNYVEAMKLFKKAAAQGSVEAQYQVGYLYEVGEGVSEDFEEAFKWFRPAAEKGSAKAQYTIGVRYAQGRDLKQDYAEALKWLRKAADQNHSEALYWMGSMYQEGWGLPKDPVEAYFWGSLAKAYGTMYGSRLSVRLTPEQLAAIEKRVAEWIAAHPKRP